MTRTERPDERQILLKNWAEERLREKSRIEDSHGDTGFSIVSGDASFRRYFRLHSEGQSYIAVDAPVDSEDSESFIRVDELLLEAGVRVPVVYASDLQQGFMLLEDFGNRTYLPLLLAAQNEQDMKTPQMLYQDAITTLVTLQKRADKERLGSYDRSELRREMEVFTEWMCEGFLEVKLDTAARKVIDDAFSFLEDAALSQPTTVVHRDYHSRNLLVTDDGSSPGVIDFQDALCGPYTYDLVSLLRDCYIRWPQTQIDEWASQYLQSAESAGVISQIEPIQFQRDFDLMGLQRHLKVLGVFCRLYLRDNKSGYLADIPLVIQYFLEVSRGYPELGTFLAWFEGQVLPRTRDKLTLED